MSADSSRACSPSPRATAGAVRTLRVSILLALVGAGLLSLTATASAAVSGNHIIAALPDTSGLELTYPDSNGAALTVKVLRNGIPIANATAHIVAGAAAVNGGAGDCWSDVTPDILPGDVIEVIGATFDDKMTVQGTTSDAVVQTGPSTVELHGTATDSANGQPLAIAGLSARLIGNGPFDQGTNGGKQLRAGTGNAFPLSYDPANPNHWTATFSGLSTHDMDLALSAQTRGVWTSAALNETTISQHPVARGPVAPCTTPAAPPSALTSNDHAPAINIANFVNSPADLVLGGTSVDTSTVTVKLTDGTTTLTESGTPSSTTGGGTWTVTFPHTDVASLNDGTLTATPTFATSTVGTFNGQAMSIPKDTVAPGAPTATPGAGTYIGTQSVTLADDDASAVIHWTNNGSTPTGGSPSSQPINVSAKNTTIKAIAIDPAGNPSPVASFAYVINTPPPPPPQPQSGGNNSQGSQGTVTTIIQQIPIAGGVSAGAVTAIVDLTPPTVTLTLPSGGARLAGSGITFTLSSDEPGLATVGGSIGQRGSSRLFKLRAASRTLTRGQSTQVTVRVPISSLKALRRALGQHRVVQIHLTIKAVDPAGNARTLTRTLRVRSA
jgi:hypothetical protein